MGIALLTARSASQSPRPVRCSRTIAQICAFRGRACNWSAASSTRLCKASSTSDSSVCIRCLASPHLDPSPDGPRTRCWGRFAKNTSGSLDCRTIHTMDPRRLRCNCCVLHDPIALWPGPTGASPPQFQLDGACLEATSPSFRLIETEKPINAFDAPNVLQTSFRV